MINAIEIIGLVACLCTTLSAVPQIIKIYQINSTQGLSLLTYILSCSGVVLWLLYGVLLHSIPLVISNIICLVFQLIIIRMIIKNNFKK